MIPIPAIDLRGGHVVRLFRGDFNVEKIYPTTAEAMALSYQEDGAKRIHIVDLDGALRGEPKNMDAIESVLKKVKVPIEVGGGIRDLKSAARYFSMGVSWVILGTKACLDQGFMVEAVQEFGDKIIVGMDALGGMIATDGWTKVTKIRATELAKSFEAVGGKTIIYTDISKDGALAGPNLTEVSTMCDAVGVSIIASGGVGSLVDVKNLLNLKRKNLAGVIIGKALYESKISLKDAVKTCLQSV